MSLGPIMFDLQGLGLADAERELLLHPLAGGVILFARNFNDAAQLRELCDEIHGLRDPPLLIAVDHEGGRVQRFHEQFTRLPPCHCYGEVYDKDPAQGLELARQAGWIMAAELLSAGVDFSFAPVLDLDLGLSQVIGDRAFHRDPDTVAVLARRFMQGMKAAGMAAVGKHFPGHGHVREDSHHEMPVDRRRYEDIALSDLLPFERLIAAGLAAVMPAHVAYPQIDARPAGYSVTWLQEILRKQLGFQGVIFSDDISMDAAGVAGGYLQRTEAALAAGCDMVLICNNQQAAAGVLQRLPYTPHPAQLTRLIRMHGRGSNNTLSTLRNDEQWQSISRTIAGLDRAPELDLGDDGIKS